MELLFEILHTNLGYTGCTTGNRFLPNSIEDKFENCTVYEVIKQRSKICLSLH